MMKLVMKVILGCLMFLKKRKKNKEPQEEHLEALNANGELIIHKKKKKKIMETKMLISRLVMSLL
ncbi:hypothetical protein NQ314_008752 [Rhamnusium bicolor]|uniref:Uncharacterized protein n=1 Tax=Rhamnusium bicolor TaxID=1586634 RepID=A0AAV8Y643_9CUCU|nr:hypothetical protein NQ314_008752 [Rhamnusium bicolor]